VENGTILLKNEGIYFNPFSTLFMKITLFMPKTR